MIDHFCLVWWQVMRVHAVGLDFTEGGSVQHESVQLFVLGKQRRKGQQQDDPQATLDLTGSKPAGSADAAHRPPPLMYRGYPSVEFSSSPQCIDTKFWRRSFARDLSFPPGVRRNGKPIACYGQKKTPSDAAA